MSDMTQPSPSKAVKSGTTANGWLDIESAPKDGTRFLGYGSYLYPDDKGPTEYIEIVEYSGDPEWPWRDADSKCRPECYSHWQPLPAPPSGEATT